MLGRFRSAIYSAIGTEVEAGTPAVPGGVSNSGEVGRIGKVSNSFFVTIETKLRISEIITFQVIYCYTVNINIMFYSLLKMPPPAP